MMCASENQEEKLYTMIAYRYTFSVSLTDPRISKSNFDVNQLQEIFKGATSLGMMSL